MFARNVLEVILSCIMSPATSCECIRWHSPAPTARLEQVVQIQFLWLGVIRTNLSVSIRPPVRTQSHPLQDKVAREPAMLKLKTLFQNPYFSVSIFSDSIFWVKKIIRKRYFSFLFYFKYMKIFLNCPISFFSLGRSILLFLLESPCKLLQIYIMLTHRLTGQQVDRSIQLALLKLHAQLNKHFLSIYIVVLRF